jgi:hypothetical protein
VGKSKFTAFVQSFGLDEIAKNEGIDASEKNDLVK